jgi:hypothetical protein
LSCTAEEALRSTKETEDENAADPDAARNDAEAKTPMETEPPPNE